jgi:hypothetical protein
MMMDRVMMDSKRMTVFNLKLWHWQQHPSQTAGVCKIQWPCHDGSRAGVVCFSDMPLVVLSLLQVQVGRTFCDTPGRICDQSPVAAGGRSLDLEQAIRPH